VVWQSVDELIEALNIGEARAVAAIASLRSLRQQVEENVRQLEGPNAAFEHVDFFVDMFGRAADEIGRISRDLPQGIRRVHGDALRQIASNSAVEQRRSVMFRDKWINKPLPYEAMRPVLNGISNTIREQLDVLRGLTDIASALDTLLTKADEKEEKGFDRRALFTRLFKPPDGDR
jgi:hypothetical protein